MNPRLVVHLPDDEDRMREVLGEVPTGRISDWRGQLVRNDLAERWELEVVVPLVEETGDRVLSTLTEGPRRLAKEPDL